MFRSRAVIWSVSCQPICRSMQRNDADRQPADDRCGRCAARAPIDYDTVKDLDAFTYVVTLSNGVQEASCTSASIPVENTAVDTTDAPALVVTEIIPDTSNTNGADAL